MLPLRQFTPLRLIPYLAAALVVKVTLSVVLNYRHYFPPDFDSDFLFGREGYFFGAYRWAFYTHLVAGPISLLVGLLLVSDRFRKAYPRWHRLLGKVQVLDVSLLLTPSGLWMAYYAEGGPLAAIAFFLLAILTAYCTWQGWRFALRRQFQVHRQWMWRSYLLLCSAIVLRLMVGLTIVLDYTPPWTTPLIAWSCWLLPLLIYEVQLRRHPSPQPRTKTLTELHH